MRLINRLPVILSFIFIQLIYICFGQECSSFHGEVNDNNINIRSDSTISSEIICKVNKGDYIEVILELYDWYKIKLPKTAPLFIRKNLVACFDNKTAKVLKDKVNIRLRPNESSPIIGKADKDEVINILEDSREWYKIEPVNNSFGWIHKKFVNKTVTPTITTAVRKIVDNESVKKKEEDKITSESTSLDECITIEGVIKPKIIKHITTHKLIDAAGSILLLKGDKEKLNALNYHKVRVVGKLISPDMQKYRIIEVLKIEAID